MSKVLLAIAFFFLFFQLTAQNLRDLSFGTDSTLEIATWNLEWFPKDGQTTIDSVTQIIEALNIDILALQEINDTASFNQLLANLPGWDGHYAENGNLRLAYIYNTNNIYLLDIYEIYQDKSREFPRSPLVMEAGFQNQRFFIINNHLKCCGDATLNSGNPWDEETRRRDASKLLKDYVDSILPDERVIIPGDLNDLLIDPGNNVFQSLIDDAANYLFADMDIALANPSEWSYPGWPSHIDHILISNELFNEFINNPSNVTTIKIDDYLPGGFNEYNSKISDHRPVALRLFVNAGPPVGLEDNHQPKKNLGIFPNPSNSIIHFSFKSIGDSYTLEIYNSNGQKVHSFEISEGISLISWDAVHLPKGLYYAKLMTDQKVIAVGKLMLVD